GHHFRWSIGHHRVGSHSVIGKHVFKHLLGQLTWKLGAKNHTQTERTTPVAHPHHHIIVRASQHRKLIAKHRDETALVLPSVTHSVDSRLQIIDQQPTQQV